MVLPARCGCDSGDSQQKQLPLSTGLAWPDAWPGFPTAGSFSLNNRSIATVSYREQSGRNGSSRGDRFLGLAKTGRAANRLPLPRNPKMDHAAGRWIMGPREEPGGGSGVMRPPGR